MESAAAPLVSKARQAARINQELDVYVAMEDEDFIRAALSISSTVSASEAFGLFAMACRCPSFQEDSVTSKQNENGSPPRNQC